MRYLKIGVILLAAQYVFISCKKDNNGGSSGGAVINIVNTIVGSKSLVANFNSNVTLQYYIYAQQIPYGTYVQFNNYSGTIPLSISQITDTTHMLYEQTLNLTFNTTHSLFLTGTIAQPDTFYTADNIPYYSGTDSVIGVRFVNLSPGSGPVNINIQGSQGSKIASDLTFKSITGFMTFPASTGMSEYIFEIRDATSDSLLTTYDYNSLARFKNVTVAINGILGGSGESQFSTFLINNY